MKQRVVVAMLAVCALLSAAGTLQGQTQGVIIKTSIGEWIQIASCPNEYTTPVTFTITEQVPDDIYGSSGQLHTFCDLMITLPPGMQFENNSTTMWSTPNHADIQNKLTTSSTGGVTYGWYDGHTEVNDCYNRAYGVGLPTTGRTLPPNTYASYYQSGAVNTLILSGLEIKNTQKVDEISITGIKIKLLPGSGPLPSTNVLWAWTLNESGTVPPNRFIMRGMPTFGYTSPSPVISFVESDATAVKFIIQPASETETWHDVQARIKGTGWSSSEEKWPTLQAIDCNGYNTGKGLSGENVALTLVDPSSVGGTLWTASSSGPTYSGAVQTITPELAATWSSSGTMPLTFSVSGVQLSGIYRITASPTNILSATSNEFLVAQRVVSWSSIPYLDAPVYNGSNYNIFMSNNPQAYVEDFMQFPISGVTVRMDLYKVGSVPPFGALDPISNSAAFSTSIMTSTGYANFGNQFVFTLTGPDLSPTPAQFNAVAFVTTSLSQNSVQGLYLDPRYTIDNRLIINSLLPVELTAFTGQVRNEVVTLRWTTATETNNYGFEVERSFDLTDWSKVGFVAGGGTTSSQRDYSFQNALSKADLMIGTISYRLRQIDRDGSIEYSPVVTVSVAPTASSMTLLQNFPNPFNPSTNISFNLPESGAVTLTVYNELGIEVARIHDAAQLEAGWHTAAFNASALTSGLYSYRLSTPAGSVAKTMIVAK